MMYLPLSWITQTKIHQEPKKGKYTMKHLDTIYSSNIQKSPPNYKNPLQMSKCTPPFCDGMPKGNQNPSSKGGGGGGGGDRLKCSRSACKARILSSKSTKSWPWAAWTVMTVSNVRRMSKSSKVDGGGATAAGSTDASYEQIWFFAQLLVFHTWKLITLKIRLRGSGGFPIGSSLLVMVLGKGQRHKKKNQKEIKRKTNDRLQVSTKKKKNRNNNLYGAWIV